MCIKFRSIAIFTWGLSGGAFANLSQALAKGFLNAGFKEVFILYLKEGPKSEKIDNRIKYISFNVDHSWQAVLKLKNFLKSYKIDVLLTMPSNINIFSIIGWLLAKRPCKLVISEHAIISFEVFEEHKNDLRFRVFPIIARILYPFTDALVAINESIIDDLEKNIKIKFKNTKVAVIPNPVDQEKIIKLSGEKGKLHEWLVNKKYPVLVSVGRLAHQKNFKFLIKAFKILRGKLDAKLIIIGEGPLKNKLNLLIKSLQLNNDVCLLGWSDNPWKFMKEADIFVLTSEEESFGLVIVEAMVLGLPIVCVDSLGGGPSLILDKGRYGVLTDENLENFSNALFKVLSDKKYHEDLSKKSLERAKDFYLDRIIDQWLKIFQKI